MKTSVMLMMCVIACIVGCEKKDDVANMTLAEAETKYVDTSENKYSSTDLGISIDVPVVKDSKNLTYSVAAFYLPAADNFAANVNLQKQGFTESADNYDKLTMKQIEQFNLTVINRVVNQNDLQYEYKGNMQGRMLHFYARAIKSGPTIYLATATSLESQWEQQKLLLIKSVDSLVVKPL